MKYFITHIEAISKIDGHCEEAERPKQSYKIKLKTRLLRQKTARNDIDFGFWEQIVVVLFFLCSTEMLAQSSIGSDTLYQPHKEKLSTFERSFKPSFYDTEVYLYGKNDSTRTFGKAIDQLTSAPPETLQGFRIQILATNNFDEANTTRNTFSLTFPELWVYLVFEAPTYKIRVGDFSNRAEAKTLLDQFQSQGYKTAWIVPDRIIRNQPPKPPIPATIDSTSIGN